MKRIGFLFILIFLFFANVNGQDYIPVIDTITQDVIFTETITINLSKENLYKNAQLWVSKMFRNYKEVIESDDFELGRIVIKPVIYSYYDVKLQSSFNFTLTVDIKNNKYRYVFSNIYFYHNAPHLEKPVINTLNEKMKKYKENGDILPIEEVKIKIIKYIITLKESMSIKDDF